jgi:carbonic anhydrase
MCVACGLSRRGLFGALSSALLVAAAGPAPTDAISGDEALHRLMAGNARYRAGQTPANDYAASRASRVVTHRPIASILSCADARVGPEFIFDQGPGNLFVVRVAGNVVTPEGLASLEYAAEFLGSRLIFVLGHEQCGAMEAAVKVVNDNASLPGHLPGLIDLLKPSVEAAKQSDPSHLLNAAIAENVRRTVQQMNSAQPMLSSMIAAGKVKVAGGVYSIAKGAVTMV